MSLSRSLLVASAVLLLATPALANNIDIDPLSIDFGSVEIGESATATVSLTNVGTYFPAEVDSVRFLDNSYDVFSLVGAPPDGTWIEVADAWEFDVVFTPTSAWGSYAGTLLISSTDLRHPDYRMPLSGAGIPVVPEPASIVLGAAACVVGLRLHRRRRPT